MKFPDLNTWHEVPEGATIPEGMRYAITYASGNVYVALCGDYVAVLPTQRHPSDIWVTEEPIPDPQEEIVLERARKMYAAVYPGRWDWESANRQTAWIQLARKYKEVEG